MSLIPQNDVASAGLTTHELPNLLRRWMTLQEEITTLNAEIKQRRTTSKALKDVILRIMESNNVANLNVSRGMVSHNIREVKESLTPEYIRKHCKDFFGGDEAKAAQLVEFLNEHRGVSVKHDLRLKPVASDTGSNGSR